jgi:D-alanine--D-alanine ligase
MRVDAEVREWFGNAPRLPDVGTVHFIGIGGAGMSALARILLARGRDVSGSDIAASQTIDELRELGARVTIGHFAENIENASAVIVTDAIDLNENPEFIAATKKDIALIRRSQLLGQLLQGHRVLAISGTHGKSTTTAILGQILERAGFDPLVVIGADMPGYHGSVRLGEGEFAVVEACEAYNSFFDIAPEIVVLTNVEPDHMDFHGSIDNLFASIEKFAQSASGSPKLIYCKNDPGACQVARSVADSIAYEMDDALASSMSLPGVHNAMNASGAVAAAVAVCVDPSVAVEAARFARAPLRRLTHMGEIGGVDVLDDYAHHPTEIKASIDALRRQFSNRRLIVVFQPHLYSRTQEFMKEFAEALSDADIAVLTDIYPARENPIPGVSSAVIVERLENLSSTCVYVPSRRLLPREVAKIAEKGDVIVGMGAGSIADFAPSLLDELERRSRPLRMEVWSGGDSAEREVSLLSGRMVAAALKRKGYSVTEADPAELLLGTASFDRLKGDGRPDVVFLAVHGTGSEDGGVQGFLELLHIPYTGSDVRASALTMDKAETKRRLAEVGLPVPKGALLRPGDPIPTAPIPCVVKPNAQGSTIGLTFIDDARDIPAAVARAFKYDRAVLVEEMVDGTEISVPVLAGEALPAVEICPASGKYDFEAKYTMGGTKEIVPARISSVAEQKAREYALTAHNAVGALDASRTDMIVKGDEIVVLEVNTLPGLTETSLLPNSAASVGISYDDLCERILLSALKRYGIEKAKV